MWQICVGKLCLNSSRTWDHKRPKKHRTFDGRSKTIEIQDQRFRIWVYASAAGLTVWDENHNYGVDCIVTDVSDTLSMETRIWDNGNRRILASHSRGECVYSIHDDRDTTLECYNFEVRRHLTLVLPGKHQLVDCEIKFLRGRLKIATAERGDRTWTIRYINLCPPYQRMCKQAGRQSE